MATDRDGDVGGNSGAFNPMTPNVSVDFTGASKGSTPDTSTATLIKTASTALGNVVEGGIRYVGDRIEEGAQEAVDSIQNIHLGYEDDIARRARSTDELTDAYRQRAISPSYYWMHMDQASRALRAQYPNFRPEIDAAFSKRTGGIPANKLIAELQQNAASASAAANSQAERERKEIAEIAKAGHLPPDYGAPGTNYDLEYIRARHYSMAGEEARVKANDASLEHDEKKGKYDTKKAVAAAESELEGSFKFRFEDSTSWLGQDYQAWKANAVQLTSDPTKATPEAVRTAQAAAAVRMDQDIADVRARMAKYNTTIPVEERDRIANSQIERIKANYGLMIDGKINILAQTKAHVEYSNLNADSNILSKQGAAQLIATRRNYGDPLTEGMFARNPELWTAAEATMSHGLVSGPIMNDNVPAMTALKAADEAGASSSAKKVGLQQAVAVMTDPLAPAGKRNDIGKNLFGPENNNMLESLKPKDRKDAYAFFTGPKVTEYMATRASPEEKQRWVDWTEQSFLSLNRTVAQTVGDAARGNDFVNVRYDPTFNRVIVDETADKGSTSGANFQGVGASVLGGLSRLEQRYFGNAAKEGAETLNAATAGLANAWRASGMSNEDITKNIGVMLHQIGVSEQAKAGGGAENSFWGSLANSLRHSPSEGIRSVLEIGARERNAYRPGSSDTVTEGTVRAAKDEGRRADLSAFDAEANEVQATEVRAVGPGGAIQDVGPEDNLQAYDPFTNLPAYDNSDNGGTRITTYSNDTITSDRTFRNPTGGEAPAVETRNGRTVQGQRARPFSESDAQGQGVPLANNQPNSLPPGMTSTDLSSLGASISNGDPEQLRGLIDYTGVRGLLDFAGQFESNGNYNATVGKRPITNLTDHTIKEVLDLQKSKLTKRNGYESTAIGKYQFLKQDILDIVRTTGLDPNTTKFSPEVQDVMALARLKHMRGYDDYVDGKITKEKFALKLAQQWAAFPKKNGESYYKGVGSNKAGTTYAALLDAIPDVEPALSGASGVVSKGGSATESMMQLAKDQHMAIINGVQKIGIGEEASGVPNAEPLKGILNQDIDSSELEARINEAILDPKARKDSEEMDAFNREIGGEFFGLYNQRKDAIIIGLNQAITDSQTMSQDQKDKWVDMLTKMYNNGQQVAEKSRLAKNASNRKQGRYRGGESDSTPASIIMNEFIKNELGK